MPAGTSGVPNDGRANGGGSTKALPTSIGTQPVPIGRWEVDSTAASPAQRPDGTRHVPAVRDDPCWRSSSVGPSRKVIVPRGAKRQGSAHPQTCTRSNDSAIRNRAAVARNRMKHPHQDCSAGSSTGRMDRSRPADAPRSTVAEVPEVAVRAVVGLQRPIQVKAVMRQRRGGTARHERGLGRAASAQLGLRALDQGTVGGDHGRSSS